MKTEYIINKDHCGLLSCKEREGKEKLDIMESFSGYGRVPRDNFKYFSKEFSSSKIENFSAHHYL